LRTLDSHRGKALPGTLGVIPSPCYLGSFRTPGEIGYTSLAFPLLRRQRFPYSAIRFPPPFCLPSPCPAPPGVAHDSPDSIVTHQSFFTRITRIPNDSHPPISPSSPDRRIRRAALPSNVTGRYRRCIRLTPPTLSFLTRLLSSSSFPSFSPVCVEIGTFSGFADFSSLLCVVFFFPSEAHFCAI